MAHNRPGAQTGEHILFAPNYLPTVCWRIKFQLLTQVYRACLMLDHILIFILPLQLILAKLEVNLMFEMTVSMRRTESTTVFPFPCVGCFTSPGVDTILRLCICR